MTVTYSTEHARWEAVLKRDRAAGDAFVYTVSSTGIYCRPTCPARLARRANVGFYDHASEAAAMGYRPCKRCKPEVAEGQPEDAAITAVKAFVTAESSKRRFRTLRQMADQAGLSKWHFHRTFVKVTGMTPGNWAKEQQQIPNTVFSAMEIPAAGSYIPFDFESFSPATSSVTATTPTSLAPTEDLDQLFNINIEGEDWLSMINFEALVQPFDHDFVHGSP
jgi:methylphosphotriester-DNA--protein-cysteine methyltransferase